MSAYSRLLAMSCTIGLLSFLSLGSPSAQEYESGVTAKTSANVAAPSAAKTAERFERAERIEEMRYRHLWIAYSLIWLIVFVFVFRTWKLNQSTAGELEALNRRLKSLEADAPVRSADAPMSGAGSSTTDSEA